MRSANNPLIRRVIVIVLTCGVTSLGTASRGSQSSDGFRVPANAIFKLETLSTISTSSNKKGDRFNCIVVEPVEFKDAVVEGYITKLKSGGRAGKTSELALAFKTINMKDGRTVKFDAQITDVYEVTGAGNQGQADNEGRVKGRSVKKRALKIGIFAAAGAILGGIFGGGTGAAIGAAAGGAVGTASSISEKSPNIELTQGTLLDVKTAGR